MDTKLSSSRVSGRSQEARSYTPPRTTYFIHCRRLLGISEAYGRDQESSEVVKIKEIEE